MKYLVCFILLLPTIARSEVQFERSQLRIAGKTLDIEVARTPKQLSQGLMFRTKMGDDQGMLFVFSAERVQSFWMKNTFIDLSIGFFNKDKKLIDIQDMAAVKSEMETNLPRYQSRGPAMYALEVKRGWFKKNKVKLGAEFELIPDNKP